MLVLQGIQEEREFYMQHLEAINETSYLSVPNAGTYRKIMRYFYREYEKMHFQLYKEDVYTLLKEENEFADYTMNQLEMDLEALIARTEEHLKTKYGYGGYLKLWIPWSDNAARLDALRALIADPVRLRSEVRRIFFTIM